MMKTALRLDVASQPVTMRRTDEGYLTGEARVARVGVQTYQDGQGGIRLEYRPVSEVFAADAIASFRNVPLTMGHPAERLVTADNAKALSIGHVGENIRPDGEWLVMPLTITDAESIRQIESGATVQLSGGYIAEMDETPGEYEGIAFDAIQRNIRGNHVAVVQKARAGEMARINLDAADAVAIAETQTREDNAMSDKTVTVRVDGIEYPAAPEIERHITKQAERIDALIVERDAAKTEAEKLKAKADEMKAEMEKIKEERSDEAIREAAKARVALERTAARVLGDDAELDDKSDREIQEAVIKAVHKDANLDDASDVYVQARFDAAIDTHKAHGDALAKQRKTVTPKQPTNDGKTNKRDEAFSDIRDAYKRRDSGTYKRAAK
jgi:hypothetical protein